MTIIATLSGPISASFNSFALFSWLASAYLIANAALQPLSGKLTDIYGRRNGLVWANIFFLAGNLICGLARAEWVIIFGRVIAGIGGGCINTIATFVASDLVPLRRRGAVQGLGNVCFGLGSGLGGVFGGWISDTWGWRWAFLIQVPFIFLSGLVVFFTVNIPIKETNISKIKRVDFIGAMTLVATLVLLLLGLNAGGNIVPWNHPLVYVSISVSVVLLCLFVYVEEKVASEPIIPVRLLFSRTVAAACLSNWFGSMAFYAFLFYGPIYFQILGASATAAGVRLIPSSVGAAVGSLGSGLIMRSTGRYYNLTVVTVATIVISSALNIPALHRHTPAWPPFVIFSFLGIGYGSMITVTLLALISAVDHKYQAVITSASYAFRSTGSTIGIAIAGAVFQNLLRERLWRELGDHKHAAKWIAGLRESIERLKDLPDRYKEGALHAYMDSLKGVWVTILVLSILSALSSLLMREHVLYASLDRK